MDAGSGGLAPEPGFEPIFEYLSASGEQLYTALHPARGAPRAAVLLAGPFAAERERAQLTTVRWARRLAEAGFTALRFDYRGLGESTGRFGDQTFSGWVDDLRSALGLLRRRHPELPVVLHGIRLGALLAAELFAAGEGQALLGWAAPPSGHDLLWTTLRRVLTTDFVQQPGVARKTREHYVAELEAGGEVNVDGYHWSRGLWQSALGCELRLPGERERRPWLLLDVQGLSAGAAAAIVAGRAPARSEPREGPKGLRRSVTVARFWEGSPYLLPPVEPLLAESLSWLADTFPATAAQVAAAR